MRGSVAADPLSVGQSMYVVKPTRGKSTSSMLFSWNHGGNNLRGLRSR